MSAIKVPLMRRSSALEPNKLRGEWAKFAPGKTVARKESILVVSEMLLTAPTQIAIFGSTNCVRVRPVGVRVRPGGKASKQEDKRARQQQTLS